MVGDVDEGEVQRRLPGRHRQRADAAFEIGDALLQNGAGRVGDARIAIAFGLEIEQRRAVIGAVECVGGGLIDRHRDRQHRLRLICGNGLRGDVWEAFQARFAIPRILEFYAATEGNFSLYNVEGERGAIGRIPSFLAHRFPAAIVKFDIATGKPLRDTDGRCIRCAPGEAGEAIGRIGEADDRGGRFEGYTSAVESDKKVLRDVFAPGDAWFRTGDLMLQDAKGFFRFVDRIGDTFRWKGENVAASEVADAIAACPGVIDASVYGVAVPHADGRALQPGPIFTRARALYWDFAHSRG